MAAKSLRTPLVVGSAMLALGYAVAEYASAHPIGEEIPVKREELRKEGAQAESVRSGKKTPEEAVDSVDVQIKGGDKGLKTETRG